MGIPKQVLALPLSCLLIIFFAISAQAETEASGQHKPLNPERSRQHPELPVLGYVTPWNTRGKELVEEWREKFDIVCPVWYTVHAIENQAEVYTVRGGPPHEEDEEWFKRLQRPSPSFRTKSLQIAPRFILDGWSSEDYRNLLFNETRWPLLSEAIMDVVENMSYDGAVIESGAIHALGQPLAVLSASLHARDKILVLVMPPIRTPTTLGIDKGDGNNNHNAMILQSMALLSNLADYFSIMTYDMTGPAGRESTRTFPEGSPVALAQQRGNVREPAPNTNADWVTENLVSFMEATDPTQEVLGSFDEEQFWLTPDFSTKFLAGIPCYGYKYPTVFVDETAGAMAQKQVPQATVAVLRGAGEPVVMPQILDLISQFEPALSEGDDGEFFFDYADDDGYWRVFIPTQESLSHVLATIRGVGRFPLGTAGVALWEVGQSSSELLSTL